MDFDNSKKRVEKKDNEIYYSQSIKAGKRIYYLDVKRSRNEDLYLAITESKKRVVGYDEEAKVTFEKHKIFLYKEDFGQFKDALKEVIDFIEQEQGISEPRKEFIPNPPIAMEEKIDEEVERVSPKTDVETVEERDEKPKKSFLDRFKF